MKIVQVLRNKKSRVLIKFDDGDYLMVPASLLKKNELNEGDSVDESTFGLLDENSRKSIRNRIVKIISRRELPSQEIMKKLTTDGFDPKRVRIVIDEMQESGVIDDDRYVRSLLHDWTVIKPKGNFAIMRELKRVGLNPDDYLDLFKARDEYQIAYTFAQRKLDRLSGSKERRRNTLVQMLMRRGFPNEVIHRVIEEILP